jgi:hypothetical protein
MNKILVPITAALALAATGAWAKAPPDATGECKDGTYTTAAQKEGACSSHGGVKKWLAKSDKAEKSEKAEKAPSKAAPEKPATKAAAAKPADATGECKDGTYTTAATKSGACAGHKGVKEWYGSSAPKADAKKEAAAPAKAPASAAAPAKPASTATAPSSAPAAPAKPASTASTPPSERTAAAGGGAGKVWVNTDSKVYHCEKDALYGKTKKGEYMTEAQAKSSGARAARGKECS